MKTLTFNRVHKNGWISYKIAGVAGAVFVDRRMLTDEALASPAQTIDVEIPGLREPGADASAAAAEKEAKKIAREAAKAAKASAAAEKAQAKLAKLQETAAKAAAAAAAARERLGATSSEAVAE